jgi:hypothetical protein
MQAVLKSIWTIDGEDASTFTPEHPECFSVWLRLFVGPSNGAGEESFDVLVCSPGWLARECERDSFVVGRHHFVVNSFEFASIRDNLSRLVGQCSGASWAEVASKVARIGYWEFEDYVKDPF